MEAEEPEVDDVRTKTLLAEFVGWSQLRKPVHRCEWLDTRGLPRVSLPDYRKRNRAPQLMIKLVTNDLFLRLYFKRCAESWTAVLTMAEDDSKDAWSVDFQGEGDTKQEALLVALVAYLEAVNK